MKFSFVVLSVSCFSFCGLVLNVVFCLFVWLIVELVWFWFFVVDVFGMVEDDDVDEVRLGSSEELLLMAAENLKKSIEHAVRQLEARKVRGEMKLRWSRSLTRQVEALVKVAEALNKIGSKSAVDWDLASYLSGLGARVPKKFVSRRLAYAVRRSELSVLRYDRRRRL